MAPSPYGRLPGSVVVVDLSGPHSSRIGLAIALHEDDPLLPLYLAVKEDSSKWFALYDALLEAGHRYLAYRVASLYSFQETV